jgi:hypothetical protein
LANYSLEKIDFNNDLSVMYITIRRKYLWLFKGEPILVARHQNDTVSERIEGFKFKMYFANSQPPEFYEKLGAVTFQDFKDRQSTSIRSFAQVCMGVHQGAIENPELKKKHMREWNLNKLAKHLR